jgi:hypothetical protein
MPKKRKPTLESLSAEIELLKRELHAVKAAAASKQLVKTAVDGPRRSEVAVDAQVVPMTGEFKRTGQATLTLTPPQVAVDLVTHGQVGTAVAFTIELNGKSKSEDVVTSKEHESFAFDYDFKDFGL